jgi:hypothetical protein
MNIEQIETKVFEALGTASVCWEDLSGTGTFDGATAKATGEKLMKLITEYGDRKYSEGFNAGGEDGYWYGHDDGYESAKEMYEN